MSLGFLAAYLLTRRALPAYGIDPRIAPSILVLAVFGGMLGAKVYYATDMLIREGNPWLGYFLRPGGLTWYGGLIGGVSGAWIGSRLYGIPFGGLLEAAAVAFRPLVAEAAAACIDDSGIDRADMLHVDLQPLAHRRAGR